VGSDTADLRRRWAQLLAKTKSGSNAQWEPLYGQKVAFLGSQLQKDYCGKTLE